jgi:hypothetical protein
MVVGGAFEDVRDIASKAVTQAVKLALLIHLLEVDPSEYRKPISLAIWQRAQLLGEYHLNEAVRTQRLAGDYSNLHHAQRLLNWLREKRLEVFAISDICQNMCRPRPKAEQAKKWCQILEDHHWIRPVNDASGRRSKRFETNPALFSQNSQEPTE